MTIPQFVLNVMALMPLAIVTMAVPLGLYWTFEPTPLRIVYAAPYLTDRPVNSPEEAARHAVHETIGGGSLYRMISYCVDREYRGTLRRAWVNDSVIWHAPDRSTVLSDELGCRTLSSRIPVPLSSPTRAFDLVQTVDVYVNPIRTDRIEFEPITLVILDNKK